MMAPSRPVPWHLWHGFSITVPLPRQRGHGSDRAKRPWLSETTPPPWQTGQITRAAPGSAPVAPRSAQGEEPLALREDASAVADGTDHRRSPRLGARAAALTAGRRHLDGDLRLE